MWNTSLAAARLKALKTHIPFTEPGWKGDFSSCLSKPLAEMGILQAVLIIAGKTHMWSSSGGRKPSELNADPFGLFAEL